MLQRGGRKSTSGRQAEKRTYRHQVGKPGQLPQTPGSAVWCRFQLGVGGEGEGTEKPGLASSPSSPIWSTALCYFSNPVSS